MRKTLLVGLLLGLASPGWAADSTIPGLSAAGAAAGADLFPTSQSGGAATKQTLTAVQTLLFGNLSQDCTSTSGGVLTCLKTNNVAFGNLATKNLADNLTFAGADIFSSTLKFSGLSAGTQVSCLGLDSSNFVVLNAAACGSGGSVSVTALTPNIVITPSPGTGTFTVGTTAPINAQTGTTYTVVSGDNGKVVTTSNASAIAVTLPQAGSGSFTTGWSACFVNLGAGVATYTTTTSIINGSGATLVLAQGSSACLASDGTNWMGQAAPPKLSGTATTVLHSDGSQTTIGTNDLAANAVTTAKMAVTAVTPGSYTSTNLTVDAAGRITAAANGSGSGTGCVPGGSNGNVLTSDGAGACNALAAVNGSGGALTLGTASSVAGTLVLKNATSTGNTTLATANVGASNFTATIQAVTDTLVGRTTTDTLTNKTLTSPVIATIVNSGTLTLPTSTDTLVGRATTDTLTNKTLTAPVISTITNTGTLTLPTATTTLVGLSPNQAFTGNNSFAGTSTYTGSLSVPVRVITAAGAITVSATTDYVICVNKSSGAATTVNLPATPATGLTYLVKDCKGDAATNNITLTPAAGNIDGSGTYVMATNRQSTAVTYNGSEWMVN